jgi:hypothetical protein
MMTEKRVLPIGVEYEGKLHKDLELQPRKAKHLLLGTKDPVYLNDRKAYEFCCLAAQIDKLGDIPKEQLTGSLILDMYEADFDVLTEAAEKARQRAGEFRGGGESVKDGDPGNAEDRLPISGHSGDDTAGDRRVADNQ